MNRFLASWFAGVVTAQGWEIAVTIHWAGWFAVAVGLAVLFRVSIGGNDAT